MKETIWAAIVECLDKYAASEKIDELLTDAVIQAFESIQPTRLAVRYVGKRQSYSDGLYNTGDWEKDQVKLVEISVAKKMFEHPDVYVPGDEEQATEVTDAQPELGDNAPHLDEARQSVQSMGVKAIKNFVANNFSGATLDLPKGTKVEEYRLEAIRMIDQYHVPV